MQNATARSWFFRSCSTFAAFRYAFASVGSRSIADTAARSISAGDPWLICSAMDSASCAQASVDRPFRRFAFSTSAAFANSLNSIRNSAAATIRPGSVTVQSMTWCHDRFGSASSFFFSATTSNFGFTMPGLPVPAATFAPPAAPAPPAAGGFAWANPFPFAGRGAAPIASFGFFSLIVAPEWYRDVPRMIRARAGG